MRMGVCFSQLGAVIMAAPSFHSTFQNLLFKSLFELFCQTELYVSTVLIIRDKCVSAQP